MYRIPDSFDNPVGWASVFDSRDGRCTCKGHTEGHTTPRSSKTPRLPQTLETDPGNISITMASHLLPCCWRVKEWWRRWWYLAVQMFGDVGKCLVYIFGLKHFCITWFGRINGHNKKNNPTFGHVSKCLVAYIFWLKKTV